MNERLHANVEAIRTEVNKTMEEEKVSIAETKQKVIDYVPEPSSLEQAWGEFGGLMTSLWLFLYSPYFLVVVVLAIIGGAVVGLKVAKTGICGPSAQAAAHCTC